MDKNQILQLIRQEIDASNKTSQYGVYRVPFHTHNNLDAPQIRFIDLGQVPSSYTNHKGDMLLVNSTATGLEFFTGYLGAAKDTNGVTAVDVFGSSGAPFGMTITSVFVISKDTTAGNITLKQATNTVATIAKGTTAGALTGATSLSNATYAKGDACTIVSSSAGNATVCITFTT